jgi:hypothetical protein
LFSNLNLKSKWSVIIPTLWKSDFILRLIEGLVANPYVYEIIIIDNNPKSRLNFDFHSLKIKLFEQEENIYVNPAWNFGVNNSSCENICICNDDIIFDSGKLFEIISTKIRLDTIFGCHPYCFNVNNIKHTFKSLKGHAIGEGWGCILFFKKNNYIPVPDELKIFYGDNWLALKIFMNYSFIFPINTKMSTSSSSIEFTKQTLYDHSTYRSILSKLEQKIIFHSHVSRKYSIKSYLISFCKILFSRNTLYNSIYPRKFK